MILQLVALVDEALPSWCHASLSMDSILEIAHRFLHTPES